MTDDDQLSSDLASLRIRRDDYAAPARATPGAPSSLPIGRVLGWLAVGALVLVAAGGGYLVYGKAKDQIVAPEVEIASVALVSPAQSEITLVATGYVVSRKKATLSAKIPGRLSKLYVAEGESVKQGQLIAELERADAEAQIAQAKAEAASARARVTQVSADLDDAERRARREQELATKGAGAGATAEDAASRVATVKAQRAAAVAEVAAIEARIRVVQVSLDNTKVYSPFNGTVLKKLADVGDLVSAMPLAAVSGGGGIIAIAAMDQLEVEADVSETQLAKILPPRVTTAADAPAPTRTPAEIILDAFPDKRFRGELWEIRPTVDRAKATVTVKVRFLDDTAGVLPDMSAKVSFLHKALDQKELAAAPKKVIPEATLVERGGRKAVYVVEGGRARVVPVTVKGPAGAGLVEIDGGPAPGAQLVKSPPPDLTDGGRVKITEK